MRKRKQIERFKSLDVCGFLLATERTIEYPIDVVDKKIRQAIIDSARLQRRVCDVLALVAYKFDAFEKVRKTPIPLRIGFARSYRTIATNVGIKRDVGFDYLVCMKKCLCEKPFIFMNDAFGHEYATIDNELAQIAVGASPFDNIMLAHIVASRVVSADDNRCIERRLLLVVEDVSSGKLGNARILVFENRQEVANSVRKPIIVGIEEK